MYRGRQPQSADAVNEFLAPYGLAPMPTFMLHAVSDEGPGGKRRLSAWRPRSSGHRALDGPCWSSAPWITPWPP
jgi:hypothetical protein